MRPNIVLIRFVVESESPSLMASSLSASLWRQID